MRLPETGIHLTWLVTHFVRSFFGDCQSRQLVTSLAKEVDTLSAELHRTQRLLAGYGNLIESCEHSYRAQSRNNLIFFGGLVILVCLLFWSWCKPKRTTPVICDSTGGSSDSDDPGPIVARPGTRSLGPVRPSAFGKGKQRS